MGPPRAIVACDACDVRDSIHAGRLLLRTVSFCTTCTMLRRQLSAQHHRRRRCTSLSSCCCLCCTLCWRTAPPPLRSRLPCSRAGELLHAPAPFLMNMLPCSLVKPGAGAQQPSNARDPESCKPGWCLSPSSVAIRDRAGSAPASVECLLMATPAALSWLLVCNRRASDVRAASLVRTA